MEISANTAAILRDAFDAAVIEYGDFGLAPDAFQAAVIERAPDEAAIPDLRIADLYLAQGCAAGHDEAWRVLAKLHKTEMAADDEARALLATYDGAEPLRAWLVAAGRAPPRRALPGGHLIPVVVAVAAILLLWTLRTDRSGEPGDDELVAAFAALRDDEPELFDGIEPLLAAERAAPAPRAAPASRADTALRIRMRRGLKAIDRMADPRVRHVVRAQFLIRLERYDEAAAELNRAPPSALAKETSAWLRVARGLEK